MPSTSPELSADGRYRLRIVAASFIDIIDQQNGQVVRSFITLPEGEWVSWTPWGPYTASVGAHEYLLLVARSGLRAQPVTEAWHQAFFRPDGFKPQDLSAPKDYLSRE